MPLGSYNISAGTKLSYGALSGGDYPSTWTDLLGATEIPEIGGDPETVETTTLDNLVYRTYIKGLQDLSSIQIPFNLENPAATANINVIAGLDEDTTYGWMITYASGITVKIKSKPSYKFNQVGVNEIESFTLTLVPEEELTIDIPV